MLSGMQQNSEKRGVQPAEPEVVAELVAYLVHPLAYYMTGVYLALAVIPFEMCALIFDIGQTITIDGGAVFD